MRKVRDGAQNVHHRPWRTLIGDDANVEWLPQWRHDPAWPTPFSVAVVFQFVQISDACFVHLLLQYSPHGVINWIQIWQFGGHSWGWINPGFSFSNNSVVARSWWTFLVTQGNVETLFRWGGKHMILRHIYSRNDVPNLPRIARVL